MITTKEWGITNDLLYYVRVMGGGVGEHFLNCPHGVLECPSGLWPVINSIFQELSGLKVSLPTQTFRTDMPRKRLTSSLLEVTTSPARLVGDIKPSHMGNDQNTHVM